MSNEVGTSDTPWYTLLLVAAVMLGWFYVAWCKFDWILRIQPDDSAFGVFSRYRFWRTPFAKVFARVHATIFGIGGVFLLLQLLVDLILGR